MIVVRKRKIGKCHITADDLKKITIVILVLAMQSVLFGGCTMDHNLEKEDAIVWGTQTEKGFVNDNALYSELGVIHFSSYIPSSYDSKKPYALFITLPGWEGLYFQGVGANMVEDFGTEAIKYKDEMIILSPQLEDWGEIVSSKWDGNLEILADAKIPVYMAIGEEDSYYGSAPLKETYQMLYNLYKEQGLSKEEIDKLLVLDVKDFWNAR